MYKKLLLLLLTISIFSCDENEPTVEKNEVQFKIVQKDLVTGRLVSEVPKSVIISITDNNGDLVIDTEEFDVIKFDDNYLIEPILLEIGSYNLTKFLVLNDAEEVIYATPLEGSNLASFVNDPLPVSFDVLSDAATDVFVEVIYTNSIDPEDLGYVNFTFDIVPTTEILVSVFGYNEISEKLEFVSGNLSVYANSDSLYSIDFGDSINVIKLRSDLDNLELSMSAPGFNSKTIAISSADLTTYRTTPLQVILLDEENLFAYFPFNGNALEVANSQIEGDVFGATPTADMNMVSNNAYEFNSTDNYITYGDNFDLGDNDFTISTWVNVAVFDGLLPGTSTRGAAILNKGITVYGTPSRAGYSIMAQKFDNINMFGFFIGGNDQVYFTRSGGEFNTDSWYNVVGRRAGDVISLFVNGKLISETTVPTGLNTDTNIPFTFGTGDKLGNDVNGTSFFNGKIDETKIYLKSLNAVEIKAIYDQGI